MFRLHSMSIRTWSLLFSILALISCRDDAVVDFNAEIRPIFNAKCITCHGGVKQSGGFGLVFRENALRQTESGKYAIVPGDPNQSELVNRIEHTSIELRMPLDASPLTNHQIDLLKAWIKQGAEWSEHWAYIKPKKELPPTSESSWIQNGIDNFILSKMKESGLDPSPKAEKETLMRRVSLDLTGLPPTKEDLDLFLNDRSDRAYEKAIDRLLASPRYGEHWASMWLDLARFADSKGYERDPLREIWQYRDWVIKAFNADMPFDQFTIEQLAGDLLPTPTNEQLIATGFHRNTMSNDEGGSDNEEFRIAAVIDRVNTTWEVWQSTTMACVQCHSHPYDPIKHEEFYKFSGFFNNTSDYDHPSESPTLRTYKQEDALKLAAIKKWIAANADPKEALALEQNLTLQEPKIFPGYFDDLHNCIFTNRADEDYLFIKDDGHFRIKEIDLTKIQNVLLHYEQSSDEPATVTVRLDASDGPVIGEESLTPNGRYPGTTRIGIDPNDGIRDLYFTVSSPHEEGRICKINGVMLMNELPGRNQVGFEDFQNDFFTFFNTKDSIRTPVMFENPDHLKRPTFVFERGNWLVKGEQVNSDVPQTWNKMPTNAQKNRLGMAQWLMSRDNPLTARVMANRIWAQIFGTGIIETTEDFGTQGEPPSHRELLDWLAIKFSDEYDWSIKQLLRLIVTSATYQQDARITPEDLEKDPRNRLLARGPRVRLSAEEIRDQALQLCGLLSNKMYGPSVMPAQPDGIWQNTVYSSAKWVTSEGENSHRRGIYTLLRRSSPYPSMMTFDGSSREFCLSRRINTNTPLQALITLNDPVYLEAAREFAKIMSSKDGEASSQLRSGFRILMFQEIKTAELEKLVKLYQESLDYYLANPNSALEITETSSSPEMAAMTVVANAMLNLDAFITKS